MVTDIHHWHPHEYAALSGNLEILQWLLQHSGRLIDLSANHNRALRKASKSGALAVVKWLVNDSGQVIDVADYNNGACFESINYGQEAVTRWLILESGQLHRILGDRGLEKLGWLSALPIALRQTVINADAVRRFLDARDGQRQINTAKFEQLLLSPVCQAAVQNQLVTTTDELECLLSSTTLAPLPRQTRI